MANAALLRHVAIGRYLPMGSPVHRLDPRAKLLSLALLVVASSIGVTYSTSTIVFVVLLGAMLVSRMPLGYTFGYIVPFLPVVAIASCFQLLFAHPSGADASDAAGLISSFGPFVITWDGIRLVVVSLIRFASLLLVISLLTGTTTVSALTHGAEHLLHPLTRLGLPGHEIALMAAIALRFLPILGEEMEAIMLAQASRGVGEQTSRWRILANARHMAALVVPLFADVYRRSEEMAIAMLARCYSGGRGRTSLSELRYRPADGVALGGALLVTGMVVLLRRLSLP